MANSFPFLREEKFGLRTQETFVGNTCEIYIPVSYMQKNDPNPLASEQGPRIESIGLFWFKVDGKDWYELQMPVKFQFGFSERRKEKVRIKPGMPELDYFIFVLKHGDAFMYDTLHQKVLQDMTTNFITKLIENANMPKTIPYSDAFNIFINAINVTENGSLGVSAVSLELLMAELYRAKGNLNKPFRLTYNGKNEFDYKMVNIKSLPGINSTFTSLIGENITNQLVSSVLRTREGKESVESPIEKVLKY